MPGPDPHSLWIEDNNENGATVSFLAYIWTGNTWNRKARAVTISRRLKQGTWRCRWCGQELPAYLRADARYCREACRKRAARRRRELRLAASEGLRLLAL